MESARLPAKATSPDTEAEQGFEVLNKYLTVCYTTLLVLNADIYHPKIRKTTAQATIRTSAFTPSKRNMMPFKPEPATGSAAALADTLEFSLGITYRTWKMSAICFLKQPQFSTLDLRIKVPVNPLQMLLQLLHLTYLRKAKNREATIADFDD